MVSHSQVHESELPIKINKRITLIIIMHIVNTNDIERNMHTIALRPGLTVLTTPQRSYEMELMSSIEAIFGNT